NLEIAGIVALQATTSSGGGGGLDALVSGSVTIGDRGLIDAYGGLLSAGGDITIIADGGVVGEGPIDCHGGDGGTVVIQTGDGLSTSAAAVIDISARAEFGDAGSITLIAGGNMTIGGKIAGQGEGASVDGGSRGGDVSFEAAGTLT